MKDLRPGYWPPRGREASAHKRLVSFLGREFMWYVRRVPVVILMMSTWYALDVPAEAGTILLTVCGYGYFAAHRYLKWIETEYES